MSYKDLEKEFEKKYRKEIEGIAKYNNVDLSVASSMFKANLNNSGNPNAEVYKGGGVATNWDEMVEDYKNLKSAAAESIKGKTTTNSKGERVRQEDLLIATDSEPKKKQ